MIKAAIAGLAVVLTAITSTPSNAAEIKLLSAAALMYAFNELLPQFEKATGNRVRADYGNVGALTDRLAKGEPNDVAIVTDAQIDQLQAQGRVTADSRVDIASVGVGVFVRKNSTKPDIGSVDEFKRTMLAAKTITYSNPAAGGAAGIYMAGLIEQLGISPALKDKTKLVPGALLYQVVANGEADIGIDQISIIMQQPSVEFVGPLPQPIQHYTVFAAAIGAVSDQAEPAKALIAFLGSPPVQARMKAYGFESGKN